MNKVTSKDGAAIAYGPEQSRGVHGMVGRVLVHATMSLDGFIAGPDDAMDWVFRVCGAERSRRRGHQDDRRHAGGRRSYDVGKRDAGKESGAPYGGAWTGPVFVLTP